MRAFELAGKQRGAALTWVIVAVLAIALAIWAFTMRGGPSLAVLPGMRSLLSLPVLLIFLA